MEFVQPKTPWVANLIFICALCIAGHLRAERSLEYELDPYYSNVGLYIPLTDKNIPLVELKNETRIYRQLTKEVFSPRFFLLEASINPLPVLGTYLKDQHRDFYDQADISPDLNLIQALTEGFEEPYALSFFVGNIIRFTVDGETETEAINKGFSGIVLSVGDQHIKNNILVDDNWYEAEWKLKGDRRLDPIYHSFSFRTGAKVHDNPDIADAYYIGLRRELFNSTVQDYKLLDNIGIDLRMDFSTESSEVVESTFLVEKRWPFSEKAFSFTIGMRYIGEKYSGSLADSGDQWRLILRPGIKF